MKVSFQSIFQNLNNSLIYTLGAFFQKGIAFLLLPFFTKYFNTSDYGILSMIYSLVSIYTIFITLKPSLMIIPLYSTWGDRKIKEYITGFIVNSAASLIIIGSISILILPQVISIITPEICLIIILIAFFQGPIEIKEAIYLVKEMPLRYLKLQLSRNLLSLIIAIFLVGRLGYGWQGKFIPELIISVLISLVILFDFWGEKLLDLSRYSLTVTKNIISYLTPLTFHALGLVLMQNIDRLIIIQLLNVEANGIYSVGYTLGALLGIIHDALLKVWSPKFYRGMNINSESYLKKFKNFKLLYIIGSIILLVIYLLIDNFVFEIMVDTKFNLGKKVIPFIALGITFEGIRKLYVGHLYFAKRLKSIAMITFSSGILNIILNYMLIPNFGIKGAAAATMGAYFVTLIITILTVKHIPIQKSHDQNSEKN